MPGPLALIGGEEFADGFEAVHAELLRLAPAPPGRPVQAVYLPTCAAHDGPETVASWCSLAKERLEAAGARLTPLVIVDRESANDAAHAAQIAAADCIYLGGGFPHTGMSILEGTLALDALRRAHQRGALLCGASAGAMLMCSRSWIITPELDAAYGALLSGEGDMAQIELPLPPPLDCLGLIPRSVCWPHLNQLFSLRWLQAGLLPPGHTLLGVDEQTALVQDAQGECRVLGRGRALIVKDDFSIQEHPEGSRFTL
ncbi:MAG: Type 1 glutamine amidotransferase-like domain-containing protein [Chloroflexi bacterium]|nr:Type 1 glutamine amidotransferase-like domain-containing protein [Chloroflexota bacterium]